MEELKDRIKEAREMARLSQIQLSKILKRSRSVVAQYEGGFTLPPIDVLLEISNVTKKPISWFFGEENIDDRLPSTKADIARLEELLAEIRDLLKKEGERS